MKKSDLWKLLLILTVIGISFWQLSYTLRYYSLSHEERYDPENAILKNKSIHLGLDLEGGSHFLLVVDTTGKGGPEMVQQVVEILRSRVDKYGVSEPVIEVQGNNYIVIELPGEMDPTIARKLIGTTAVLEFRVVRSVNELRNTINTIDEFFEGQFAYQLMTFPGGSRIISTEDNWRYLDSLVQLAKREDIADSASGAVLMWSKEEEGDIYNIPNYRELLLVSAVPEIKGGAVTSAKPALGTNNNPSEPRVDMEIGGSARSDWARITSENVGGRIAIVLDGEVFSAPTVEGPILSGNSMISLGRGTLDDAKALASILQAGRMPARADIEESFVIGPSLGADSVRSGIKSMIIGGVIILLFMFLYYRASGLIADLALVLNIIFLLAVLSGFNLTLTLPGMVGLVLVIGAGVDANVLIFERIREELAQNKTPKKAVELGFSKAFVTILDANITTLLVAIILWWFGKGPIRGFAVTLSVGLIVNMFTAIFVSRFLFDTFLARPNREKLSI